MYLKILFYRSKASHRNTLTESPTIKNQNKTKQLLYKKHKLYTRNEISQFLDPLKRSSNVDDKDSRSANTLQNNDSFISGNIVKTPLKTESLSRLSDNKAISGYSCTPKQHRTCLTPRNTKMNVLSTCKTPTKRYCSDQNLSQATPDCFSKVQLETPSIKFNDIGMDEVIEGENSNLTVGIRVRPLNLK